ncbi:MAG: Bacterial transferase hexapeptide (three repeats) [Phormidium sp. OSCR]|nr:MAG: Bacterial transferase hexapeptide (three repeats) [Phormidium sp. OSCR]
MNSLVIFGTSELAEVAYYYFSHDTDYEIAAFTVDADYLTEDSFCGLPVLPFEEISHIHPAESSDLFVAVSYTKLNRVRRDKYLAAKNLGYKLPSYISSHATVLNNFNFGENCLVLEDNTIQPYAVIGNNVTLWSGNHIGHHAKIRDHCFISSHVVVSGGVEISESCFIGVNATLRDHIKIGQRCVIGAGALILADTEPDGVYLQRASERSKVPSTRLRKI